MRTAQLRFAIIAVLAAFGCGGGGAAPQDATTAGDGEDTLDGGAGSGGGGAGGGGTGGAGGGAGAGGTGPGGRGGGAGGMGGASGDAGRGGSNAGGASGSNGGTTGSAGTGGSGGQPAVCRDLELEYASRLPRFLVCSGQNQCGNRASTAPGCPCQMPVQEPGPLELEMLFNVESEWFAAGCTTPTTCVMPCSLNPRAACQNGRCVIAN